jgi:hypothetical protein
MDVSLKWFTVASTALLIVLVVYAVEKLSAFPDDKGKVNANGVYVLFIIWCILLIPV